MATEEEEKHTNGNSTPIPPRSAFKIVTLPPTRKKNPNYEALQTKQNTERQAWNGLNIQNIGIPGKGLRAGGSSMYENKYLREVEERWTELYWNFGGDIAFGLTMLNFSRLRETNQVQENEKNNELCYRFFKCDTKLIRNILEENWFGQTDQHNWNLLWLNSPGPGYLYQNLNEYQKINHFPNTFEITRKDRLCKNIVKMQQKFGKDNINLLPDTFILPDEFADFYAQFHAEPGTWIIKPQRSSMGRGIYLIDNIDEVPLDEDWVISKYIANPLLIKDLKFDLRIYVVVTSFEPLRIYIYDEGLARFASEPFSTVKGNKFAHLTNYAINKRNTKFVNNENYKSDDHGHKWSLSAMMRHMEGVGIDTDLLWSRIYDLVIKTILACENDVVNAIRRIGLSRKNWFDLLGFDVLIDDDLKPWLMEVNLSPSMGTDSSLDQHIKTNLITDTLNLIWMKNFNRKKENMRKVRQRLRARPGGRENLSHDMVRRSEHLQNLPPLSSNSNNRIAEVFRDTYEEYKRCGNFIRIYPSYGSDRYNMYFQTKRAANTTLYNMLFGNADPLAHTTPDLGEIRCKSNSNMTQRPTRNSSFDAPIRKEMVESRRSRLSVSSVRDEIPTPNKSSLKNESDGVLITRKVYAREIQRPRWKGWNVVIRDKYAYLCPRCRVNSIRSRCKQEPSKVAVSGDDIIIEYTSRLMHTLKSLKSDQLKTRWKRGIEKFITHSVWHSSSMRRQDTNKLWKRMESRLIEMQERKRRLQAQYKGIRRSVSQEPIDPEDESKLTIVQGFSAAQLEEMLKSSTRNAAQDLISWLVDAKGRGILTSIIEWLAKNSKKARRRSVFEPEDYEEESPGRVSNFL